ncbi:MAG: hypothetical protein HY706_20325 [Candidatus Hydrogenedentes bacterium]|nr:hypothetical protein [Candidatus Hydrogenedentota bacterium]
MEKNLIVGFSSQFGIASQPGVVLRITASTLYRAFLNGKFVGHGPARGPRGFYRVDEWDVSEHAQPGVNVIAIEVAGYNANSYYLLDQPSFLQAEVLAEGSVLAATGDNSFRARIVSERVQKAQRYSFQRPFSEVYRLAPGWADWRTKPEGGVSGVVVEAKQYLPRRVPYPSFELRGPQGAVSHGRVESSALPERVWKDRSLTGISDKLGGYPESELEVIPSIELQKIQIASRDDVSLPLFQEESLRLDANAFHILDFGTNLTGFLGATVTCRKPTRLYFTFDEILTDTDVDFKRLGCVNIVAYELQPGTYRVESFEPYTLRYLKLLTLDGDCDVAGVYLREYVNPDVWNAQFAASDERFNRLFAAGRETFRQNAVDIFMDCPSRERAGWLCDSFFTSRVAFDLSGDTRVEKNFFENFLMPEKFDHLPNGMLPMCYPSDHNDGIFIPNWALWFVVQLEEYLARSGDLELADNLRSKVLRLFDYFQRFKNEDGLLEKLESWVFVEWSEANKFVQDVNYPSNMLFAAALAAASRMYDLPQLAEEAEHVRDVVRRQSYDGQFFVDNALRVDGKLEVTRNRSEVCQYFAFFFDVATPESYPELWRALREEFGPKRRETKAYPEVHMANAFVGNMLRLEILSRYGLCKQILDESLAYQLYMADRTGTLWENDGAYASCNHGFASHAVHTLYRDVLGLYRVDAVNKQVKVRITDSDLEWCEGRIPTPEGHAYLKWRKSGDGIHCRFDVPSGFTVTVDNLSGHKVVFDQ